MNGAARTVDHVVYEVQIDRVEPNDRCQQRCRTGGSAAARDEIADRDQVCADAPREGGRNATMIQVELCIPDLGFGIINSALGSPLVGRALIEILDRVHLSAL